MRTKLSITDKNQMNFIKDDGVFPSTRYQGSKLKTMYRWNQWIIGGSNLSGFSALPGGYQYNTGLFDHIGNLAAFWTSTQFSINDAWGRRLSYNREDIGRYSTDKNYKFSI